MKIKYALILLLHFYFVWNAFGQSPEIKKSPFVLGESIRFHSDLLKEDRTLNIYLPTYYHPDSSYSVIYLLDGSKDEDFIHIAGLVQFANFPWIGMIPESIVVGIANVDRKRDFTYPTNNKKDKKDFPTTGHSDKFIQFLEKEVKTYVSATYGPSKTSTIIGQSLGGLLASEILFKKPDLFDNYIIVSPSLWWDDESLLKWEAPDFHKEKSIFIGVGKEGKIMERVAQELHQKIESLKHPKLKLYYKFLEAQDHGDALHLAVYEAFTQIYSNRK